MYRQHYFTNIKDLLPPITRLIIIMIMIIIIIIIIITIKITV